ncbi:MAG: phosphate/phosphite/phosphonate ABC transporter substrate-binding protein [Planctomycetota bacterium]
MKRAIVVVMAVLLFVGTSLQAAESIGLGNLGSNPSKTMKAFTPLAEYLGSSLGTTVKVIPVKSPAEMIAKIAGGEVHFFMDSPFPAAEMCKGSDASYALRHWKKGVGEYNSVIFVKKGKAASLADLKGKIIAFEDPSSTSSYILPTLIFQDAGIKLVQKKSFRDKVEAGVVGYVFSGDDDNTVLWVKKGRAFAGGIKKSAVGGDAAYTILKESAMVPRSVVCISGKLAAETVAKLKTALMGMEADAGAAAALKAVSKTKKFDEFPGGPDKVYQDMLKLMAKLGK